MFQIYVPEMLAFDLLLERRQKMEAKFYKLNESLENSYYQIPQELFDNPLYQSLSLESKVLYGFLLSRMRLSAKNGWIDDEGYIFLIYKRVDVQKRLNLSDKTVTKAFKQLAEANLIQEKVQGMNRPNLIYIGKITHQNPLENWSRKNYESGHGKSTTPESENLRPIYIDRYKENRDNNAHALKKDDRFKDNTGQYDDLDKYIANYIDD